TCLELTNLMWGEGVVELDDRFLMCGYPRVLVDLKKNPFALRRPSFFLTHLYEGPKDNFEYPINELVHLMLHIQPEALHIETWTERTVPKLNGISGCSVWCWDPTPSQVWSPQSALKIVGIEVGVDRSDRRRWIRTTRWGLIARL